MEILKHSLISYLLSNIVLDELDKELVKRGLSFCRYADDCNIYVKSKKSADRVMASMKNFIETKLRLNLNTEKSVVGRPWVSVFLGYSFTYNKKPKIRVPAQTIKRFKSKAKLIFKRGRGRNLGRLINENLNPLIRGCINYFKLSKKKGFAEDLDSWLRRRLRNIIWREWKKPKTRYKKQLKSGFEETKYLLRS